MKKLFRVEWIHNGQWRMENNDGGVFKTRQEAEKCEDEIQRDNPTIITRIVEVK